MNIQDSLTIRLKNYQIYENAEFTFIPGINVVTGPNSSGKSSSLRAIVDFTKNDFPKDSIRAGQKEMTVEVLANGHSYMCVKNKSNCFYFDGKEYSGAGNIKNIKTMLPGFPFEVNLDGTISQISDEWNNRLFPIDKTPKELFETFEKMFGIEHATDVIDEIDKDSKECIANYEAVSREIDEMSVKVNVVEELNPDKVEDKLNNLSNRLETLKNMEKTCNSDRETVEKSCKFLDIFVPKLTDFDANQLGFTLFSLKNDLKTLDEVSVYSKDIDLPKVKTEVPSSLELVELRKDCEVIRKCVQFVNSVPNLSMNKPMPSKEDVMRLSFDMSTLRSLEKEKIELDKGIADCQNLIKETNNELGKVEVCPLCHNKITTW